MDDLEAYRIVSALANGANPLTGEVFPLESPYQSPGIIRALYAAARALEARDGLNPQGNREPQVQTSVQTPSNPGSNQKASQRPPVSGNAGKTWSSDEDRQLLAAFDAGKSLTEIARSHERTQGGVRARLEKHGRLEPSPATRWPGAGSGHATRTGHATSSVPATRSGHENETRGSSGSPDN